MFCDGLHLITGSVDKVGWIMYTFLLQDWKESISSCKKGDFPLFKGTLSRDFSLQVFSWIIFPQAHENNFRVISIFFKYLLRYSQVKVHQRYHPPVSSTGIIDTGGKCASGINDTAIPLVSLTGGNDTGGKKWEQYQTADTLKWTWRTLAANISANYRRNSLRP